MKRFTAISLLLACLLAVTRTMAAERTILLGPKTIGAGWKDNIVILPQQFATAKAGDILTVYAVGGLIVLPFVRSSNRTIAIIAIILALQPIELIYLIGSMLNPGLQPLNLGTNEMFAAIMPAQENGSWLDVAIAGIRYGFPVNFTWAIEHGRFTQTLFLFMLGILVGRHRLLYDEGNNHIIWKRTMIWSAGIL